MSTSNTAIQKGNIYSSGIPVDGFNVEQVEENLSQRFKSSPKQVTAMLVKGKMLKKGLDTETADKFISLFKLLGLEVYFSSKPQTTHTDTNETLPERDASTAPKTATSLGDGENSVLASLPESIPDAPINRIRLLNISLIAFICWLPTLIHIVASVMVVWMLINWALAVWAGTGNILLLSIEPIALLVLAIILIKPWLPRANSAIEYELGEQDAPDLFEILRALCKLSGAPLADKVIVNNQLNLSLRSMPGVAGLRNKKLTLSIGLPFIAAMDKRHFVAVLTRELAYYTQPTRKQAHILIHFYQSSLRKKANTPDILDLYLEKGSSDSVLSTFWMGLWKLITRLSILETKSLLWMSQKITTRVCEWIDMDTDYSAAYIVGSKHYQAIAIEQQAALLAFSYVNDTNNKAWEHKQLLRNIPVAVSEQLKAWADKPIKKQKPPISDDTFTPISESRLAHIAKLQFPEKYNDSTAAKELFFDFTSISEKLTKETYEQRYSGVKIDQHIVDNDEIMALRKSLSSSELAFKAFFGTAYHGQFLDLDEPLEGNLLKINHQGVIDWLRQNIYEYQDHQKYDRSLVDTHHNVTAALALLDTGIELNRNEYDFPSKDNAEEYQGKVSREREYLRVKIFTVDHMFFRRMALCIELMPTEQQAQAQHYLSNAQTLGELSEALTQFNEAVMLRTVFSNEDAERPKVDRKNKKYFSDYSQLVQRLFSEMLSITVSHHSNSGTTLRDVILATLKKDPETIANLDPIGALSCARKINQQLCYHYGFILGQLAELCIDAESENNLQPLKLFSKKT